MKICLLSAGLKGLNLLRRRGVEPSRMGDLSGISAMTGIEIVARVAELQKQYDDAHRPTRSLDAYRERHARRHPKRDYDGEWHVSQYRPRG